MPLECIGYKVVEDRSQVFTWSQGRTYVSLTSHLNLSQISRFFMHLLMCIFFGKKISFGTTQTMPKTISLSSEKYGKPERSSCHRLSKMSEGHLGQRQQTVYRGRDALVPVHLPLGAYTFVSDDPAKIARSVGNTGEPTQFLDNFPRFSSTYDGILARDVLSCIRNT